MMHLSKKQIQRIKNGLDFPVHGLKLKESKAISLIEELNKELLHILLKELKYGNQIKEISKADWSKAKNLLMVSLRYQFVTRHRHLSDKITYREVNDPHYWKEEYFCTDPKQTITCGFESL